MKISVVIPVYNTKTKFLQDCLISVFVQVYKPYEIIVVNDGSTRKETLEFLDKLKENRRVIVIDQENKKISGALNTGIRNMKGDWWAGLSSDDMWYPFKLQCQVNYVKDNPEAKVIYADWHAIDENNNITGATRSPKFNSLKEQQQHLRRAFFATWSNLLIHKEVFNKVGLFNESYPTCEDYEMNIRIAQYYFFHKVEKPLLLYRFHKEQLSNTPMGWKGSMGKIYNEKAKELAEKLYGD